MKWYTPFAAVLLTAATANAATVYVDPRCDGGAGYQAGAACPGDDSACTGGAAAVYGTVAEALADVPVGMTVEVCGATYHERELDLAARPANASEEVIIRCHDGDTCVIDGSTAWTPSWVPCTTADHARCTRGNTFYDDGGPGGERVAVLFMVQGDELFAVHGYYITRSEDLILENMNEAADATMASGYLRADPPSGSGERLPEWAVPVKFSHRSASADLFIAFGDGTHPDTKTFRFAPAGSSVFRLTRDHVTIEGFSLRGAATSIDLSGADHVTVTANTITVAQNPGIVSSGGGGNLMIRRNRFQLRSSMDPDHYGVWIHGDLGSGIELYRARNYYYRWIKDYGPTDPPVVLRDIGQAGDVTTVSENVFERAHTAVALRYPRADVEVVDNAIHNCNSVGVVLALTEPGAGTYHDRRDTTISILRNSFINNNIAIRFMYVDPHYDWQPGYNISGNMFWNVSDDGFHGGVGDPFIYYHTSVASDADNTSPTRWTHVVHNTFVDGFAALGMSGTGPTTDDDKARVLSRAHFANNLFSSTREAFHYTLSGVDIAACDYNFFAGASGAPSRCRDGDWKNNLRDEGVTTWPSDSAPPDFALPVGHRAMAAGIDVSAMFSLEGTEHPPVPGFSSGYYDGAQPHMGAWQRDAPVVPDGGAPLDGGARLDGGPTPDGATMNDGGSMSLDGGTCPADDSTCEGPGAVDGGCGCATAGSRQSPSGAWILLFGLVAAAAHRRRGRPGLRVGGRQRLLPVLR